MKTSPSHDAFIKILQQQANKQSQLEKTKFLPVGIEPISGYIANHTWQSLLLLSFFSAWFVLIMWFEFFYKILQNIL